MGRLLATLATILVLLLGAAFAVPALIDWNGYRAAIEKQASAVLGRKVSILGDIDIALLPEPRLRANDLAAGNGRADGTFLTAASADVVLSLPALLSGRIEASRLKLKHPALTLDFSKTPPREGRGAAGAGALPFGAGVASLEIEDGRIAVFPKSGGAAEAMELSGIDGIVSAQAPGGAYRFTGSLIQAGREYGVKLSLAGAQGATIKLAGSAADAASKLSFQADGLLTASEDPAFEGAITLNLPQAAGGGANRLPFELQVKSSAKIGLSYAALGEMVLTIDPQNRAQILTGSANLGFAARTAAIALNARSLDTDGLLASAAGEAPGAVSKAPQDWSSLKAAVNDLLWLYPDFAVHLSLEAGLVQLKGEPVEGVKLHGTRARRRWVFEEAAAALPGDTALKAALTLSGAEAAPRLAGTVALDGKSLGRLARWLTPAAAGAKRVPTRAFAVKGSFSLSNEVTAFEGVTGNLGGTPFTASLHFDKAPVPRLQLSLSGDNFDLAPFESGEDAGLLSPDSLKAAWQAGFAQLAATLGGDTGGFETADIDVAAANIKTGPLEAKNVAVHVKFDRDLLSVSKLSAETASGLLLRGEGALPLRGAGQGRFEGRLEARSAQAVVQAAALAGYGRDGIEPLAAGMAPASLSVNAETSAGTARAQISGSLGQARIEAVARLQGPLSEWRSGQISAELNVSEPGGNKLLALIFPDAVLAPSGSPIAGTLAAAVTGTAEKLDATAALKTEALRVELNGTAGLKAQALTFKGKVDASSQSPEQFLPQPVLTLLGGEPKAQLHLAANAQISPGRIEADGLKAESPKNSVSGHLAIGMAAGGRLIDANLNASQFSLPSLLAYFLSDVSQLGMPTLGASQSPADIWSGRPFSLSAFRETAGTVSLTAKSMSLGDALAISDAQLSASIGKGGLTIVNLSGKTFGGVLAARLSLGAKQALVAADAHISLSGANLAMLASPGTQPVAAGGATLTLSASGQGLSPLGLVSTLTGQGKIQFSAGRFTKLSPEAVRRSAVELLASQQPLTGELIAKKVLDAALSGDFEFNRHTAAVAIHDGMLEIPKTSFPGKEAAIDVEASIDLSRMQADTSWEIEDSRSARSKLPPVKVLLAGPLRELGAKQRTLAAEELIRAITVRKMEGDIARLEGLNKTPAASQGWTARTQAPAQKKSRQRQDGRAAPPPARPPQTTAPRGFEQRMRDALENGGNAPAASR